VELLPYFSHGDQWIEIDRRHVSYCKIVILKEANGLRRGFFKFKERSYGPLAANERLAYELGTMLDLPVPGIQFLTWDGMDGVVSHCIPGHEPLEWRFLPEQAKEGFLGCFENGGVLPCVGVFDAWITNCDRHGDNLMFSRTDSGKYMFYMIDHGLAFLGQKGKFANSSWNDPEWSDMGKFLRIAEIRSAMIKLESLDNYTAGIRSMSDDDIWNLANGMPEGYITEEERTSTARLLIDRKLSLDEMLRRWKSSVGKP
jgi:hypothetical protein